MKIDFNDKKTKISLVVLVAFVVLGLGYYFIQCFSGEKIVNPAVQVQNPIKKMIEPEYETTGRIEAENSIDIIARVDGWLESQFFTEGDIVKKGQKLFQIQPEEYRLAVQDAAARVSENAAVYKNSVIEYNRAALLIKDDMISRESYDNSIAVRNSKKASLDAAKAQLAKAKLNLSYTSIYAPMSGRIGKLNISKGNYVKQDSGTLASIYTTTPIRITFDLKSSDYIHIKKYFGRKDTPDSFDVVDVKLKLADGSIYDQIGKIKFADNKIDESTGTVRMRALFDNPHELLVPGDYVNVILKVKVPHEVMLVPQSATKTDVGTGYYVWVVKDGKAEKRNIVVNYNIDNNWVVEEGLDYSDVVIVKGIQSIYQSGQPVNIEQYTPETEAQAEEGENK